MSKVEIVNDALTLLGEERITDLLDNTKQAKSANAIYDRVKKALLQSYNWRCAMKQARLGKLNETPLETRFKAVFAYPADCLRIVRVEPNSIWQTYGNKLYTDQGTAIVEYIADISESEFTPQLSRVLSADIAFNLAMDITGQLSMQDRMNQIKQEALQRAFSTNDIESSSTTYKASNFELVRKMGTAVFK